jgi:hypothetical protein
MKKNKPQLDLYVSYGDGVSENWGQDFHAFADDLHEHLVDPDTLEWFPCPRNPQEYARKHDLRHIPIAGFRCSRYDEVAVYWGDEEGNIVHPLTAEEQQELGALLRKLSAK